MALRIHTLEQKLELINRLVFDARGPARAGDRQAMDEFEILKEIAQEIEARREMPRSQALGALERALYSVQRSKTALGYDEGRMVQVAQVVIQKWQFIRLALEKFGEESAE